MTSIAFFRNLNQGQRSSPTTAAIVEAFLAAGATDVRPVRGNGTVLFDGPPELANVVRKSLRPWDDLVIVRDVDWLAGLLANIDSDSRTELTLFDASFTPTLGRGKRCAIIAAGPGYAIVLSDSDGQSDGTPTVERMLGVAATSRGIPTLRKAVSMA